MPRRIFIDTEWTAPPWSAAAELMWIGLADEHGRSWYGISAEVEIDPVGNPYMAGVFRWIRPDEPRLPRAQLATAARAFCGDLVDEFWAWVPTLESFSRSAGVGNEPEALYARCWNVDLQMLQGLVQPWPDGWPRELHDLNRAAVEAGVPIPPRAADYLHPRVHAEWNRDLYAQILSARTRTASP